jgi:hypothetical protein
MIHRAIWSHPGEGELGGFVGAESDANLYMSFVHDISLSDYKVAAGSGALRSALRPSALSRGYLNNKKNLD